jgi:hypothetical protein
MRRLSNRTRIGCHANALRRNTGSDVCRGYSNRGQASYEESRHILVLYNDLLAFGRLCAPEDLDDDVDLDLFCSIL